MRGGRQAGGATRQRLLTSHFLLLGQHLSGDALGGGFVVGGECAVDDELGEMVFDPADPAARRAVGERHQLVAVERAREPGDVRLGQDLPPRPAAYGRDEVAAAVAEVMAAIELVDDRYQDFVRIGAATLIADNAFDAGSLLGPPVMDWRPLDLGNLQARTLRDGAVIAEGRSDALLGHPLKALAWLANRRSSLGLGLAAGTFVSLGSITPVEWVAAPARYRIEVEALGSVEVTVS